MAEKKVTKSQRFEDIIAMLKGEPTKHDTTVEIACKALEHEMELLANKNKSGSKKQTATQKENEGFKTLILNYLATQTEGKTCTEIQKAVPELAELTNQRVSAQLRQLKLAGSVVCTEVKGKSLFSLA